ncbi:Predicted secreted protein [Hathewaya proteolytica DSM 3090]|uniref:Predicted secreted protein n=1 Tax=Hathewaya proteolytica DSM 3090 TaxID=1121331 RepID=A0A1M6PK90_9CLOT|nr:CD3072 family TudS-related putative desulfidase [Hathewaya proteolytica]SHK08313.1 Predicted secreted protein [Hathewaya proteolytica DSM 3090]
MEKKNIVFVSHCVLNTASKVTTFSHKTGEEETARKDFLHFAVDNDIHLIQLPCPEFNIYGASRWGHTKEQFDNPFFEKYCIEMLEPYILQMREYIKECNKFSVLGVVGINGSPSCGIDITCSGNWGGEFSGRDNLQETIKTIHIVQEKGMLMKVLQNLMKENKINLPMMDLKEAKIKILDLIRGEINENLVK